MKPWSLCLIILASLTVNLSKATQNTHTHPQDSIYKVWRFTGVDFVKSSGTAEFSCPIDIDMNNYDIWDLTKKGELRYSITDTPGVFHSAPYKLINNAITLQFPDKRNNITSFKIKQLTATTLKLIIHVTCTLGGKLVDRDVVELDFEAKNR